MMKHELLLYDSEDTLYVDNLKNGGLVVTLNYPGEMGLKNRKFIITQKDKAKLWNFILDGAPKEASDERS